MSHKSFIIALMMSLCCNKTVFAAPKLAPETQGKIPPKAADPTPTPTPAPQARTNPKAETPSPEPESKDNPVDLAKTDPAPQVEQNVAPSSEYSEALGPEDSSLCNWDSKDSVNPSFGYFSLGLGYINSGFKYSNTTFKNTQPKFLGNPELSNLPNPNFDDGMSLSSILTNERSSSPMGSFEFGYNAALGQSKAFLGFFGSMEIFDIASTIPVVLKKFNPEIIPPTPFIVLPGEQQSYDYQSIFSKRMSFNAGVSLGYQINDRLFGFVKVGWSGVRLTSSKMSDGTNQTDQSKKSSGYSPNYVNGLTYGAGLDVSLTERTSIGIEAFGAFYGNKAVPLFVYQSNPGGATPNTATTLGAVPSIQKLLADPISIQSFGVMATFKINFLER